MPPAPAVHDVTIPAGTAMRVTVLSTLASNTSKLEDPVLGSLAAPVIVDGRTVVPAGAEISGSVTDVKGSGRVKGKALIAFRFSRLAMGGTTYRIQTARVIREASKDTKDDVKKGGIGAGLGAVVGGIAGGGSGAAIGAIAGGTTGVLATKGHEVELAVGTPVTVLMQEALTVPAPTK